MGQWGIHIKYITHFKIISCFSLYGILTFISINNSSLNKYVIESASIHGIRTDTKLLKVFKKSIRISTINKDTLWEIDRFD